MIMFVICHSSQALFLTSSPHNLVGQSSDHRVTHHPRDECTLIKHSASSFHLLGRVKESIKDTRTTPLTVL